MWIDFLLLIFSRQLFFIHFCWSWKKTREWHLAFRLIYPTRVIVLIIFQDFLKRVFDYKKFLSMDASNEIYTYTLFVLWFFCRSYWFMIIIFYSFILKIKLAFLMLHNFLTWNRLLLFIIIVVKEISNVLYCFMPKTRPTPMLTTTNI